LRLADDERLTEAGGEGRRGLRNAIFGTWCLGSVSTQEPVLSLRGVELGNRWEHSEGITAEIDDIFRLRVDNAWNASIVDIFNRIS
jgi:hypothetical protein